MTPRSLHRLLIAVLFLLAKPAFVFAKDQTSDPNPPSPYYPSLDAAPEKPEDLREDLGDSVNGFANSIDSYFGDIRADDERSGSTMRITPNWNVSEFATPQTAVDVRLNLKLKNLEQFGQDINDKIFGPAAPENKAAQKKDIFGNDVSADNWNWNRSIETHAAGLAPPNYGILVRFRKNYQTAQMVHRFWWSTGWQSDVLWENNANFSSDYKINKRWLLRLFNQWTWNMSSSLQTTSHGPSFFQTISDNLSMSYDLRFNMQIIASSWDLNNYGASMTMRRRLSNRWMYLTITPGINFAYVNSFQRALSFFAGLEMVFGDNK